MNYLALMLVQGHEGFRPKPYTDTAGKTTIGYGRNLTDVGISHDEAVLLVYNDVETAERFLSTYSWWRLLSTNRQACLIDMVVNVGQYAFQAFVDLLNALGDAHFHDAADAMLDSAWAKEVPARAKNDADLMRAG